MFLKKTPPKKQSRLPTELPKTKEEFEERLIFKSFFLKSMNAFAPIFYVAFFKGRCVECVSVKYFHF